MNKHTSGAWNTQPVAGSASFAHRIFADRREIAMVWHHPGQRPKQATGEQEQADARLMASAPDLLEALKRLREWVRHPGADDSPENEAVIYQAEAAIAKAEGRQGE